MDWTARFPSLAALDPAARDALLHQSRVIHLPAGETVYAPGQEPQHLILVISGTVRVQQTSAAGREIVLYRVHAGESCVMTTTCLLSHAAYTAEAVTESAATAVAIPRALIDRLLAESPVFRSFVFESYAQRITELFAVIEDIAFGRMDLRLTQRLNELAKDGIVHATHAQLAAELGTAREVVSRLLSEFQRRGLISTSRGAVTILDPQAFSRLAHVEG